MDGPDGNAVGSWKRERESERARETAEKWIWAAENEQDDFAAREEGKREKDLSIG